MFFTGRKKRKLKGVKMRNVNVRSVKKNKENEFNTKKRSAEKISAIRITKKLRKKVYLNCLKMPTKFGQMLIWPNWLN